jgi:DNA-binding FadR family transcriptional regulator
MTDDEIASPGRGLHGRLIDELGLAICDGRLAAGTVVTVDELERRYGMSRSVVRESVRVVESLGLAESRKRVGIIIRGAADWNLFHPLVIRWRIESSARRGQLRELAQLRLAVEPEAARLAAGNATPSESAELVHLAERLSSAGAEGDGQLFVETDILFHGLVLSASGNAMFAKLDSLVGEALRARTEYGLVPQHPHSDALAEHEAVALAIAKHRADRAHDAMRGILLRSMEETDERSS